MEQKQARKRAWRKVPPDRGKSVALQMPGQIPKDPDEEARDAALCAEYEREQERIAQGEVRWGCDFPEGALALGGCRW